MVYFPKTYNYLSILVKYTYYLIISEDEKLTEVSAKVLWRYFFFIPYDLLSNLVEVNFSCHSPR